MKKFRFPLQPAPWMWGCAVLAGFSLSPAEEPAKISRAHVNDTAALLAGTDLHHDPNHPATLIPAWQRHREKLHKDYTSHVDRVLSPLSQWAAQTYSESQKNLEVVRYPFGGPDILHALHAFPSARTYVLIGLEPVGELPRPGQITPANAATAFAEVHNALGEILHFSFFRTVDMKEDLNSTVVTGTTPILAVFLALSSQYIHEIEYVSLQKDGTLSSLGHTSQGANGVRLEFSPHRLNLRKNLYYFSSDLSDGGFEKSGLKQWMEQQPDGHSYLKAASFLLHSSWFSQIRTHLLERSEQIVQDDSGIPYRHFSPADWTSHLYGVYSGPLPLFAEHQQDDLVEAYRQKSVPLDFGIGYKWRKGESNLMRLEKIRAPRQLAGR